jgi:hypothetical protein
MSSPEVLYLTFDGILSPLGFSQVARVVCALADRGARYSIVSLERASDLADADRVDQLRRQLAGSGVDWVALRYDGSGTARAAAANLAAALRTVFRVHRSRRLGLIHARAYHSAFIAYLIRRATGLPYLFDARCYWIDERATEGRWFRQPSIYAAAKRLEGALFRGARAIVTLTDIQAEDLRAALPAPPAGPAMTTITTTADFADFVFGERRSPETLPPDVRARLEQRVVVGLVGSLNASYRAEETGRLCRMILEEDSRAHVLVLSAQHDQYRSLLQRHGISADRYTLAQASHQSMPVWLSWVDWGLLLLNENFAKRASMPTKLAEYFAVGVRPVQYGCNAEVSSWVRRVGTGLVLPSLEDDHLRSAARTMARTPRDPSALARGRELAVSHFSLAGAVEKYQQVLATVLPGLGSEATAGPISRNGLPARPPVRGTGFASGASSPGETGP